MSEILSTAEAFGRFAVELYELRGVEETVEAVVHFALQAVQCDDAAVVLMSRSFEVLACTRPGIEELYRTELQLGSGPSFAAAEQREAVVINNVTTDQSLPAAWVDRATRLGIRSAVHLPLAAKGRVAAVFSFFGARPDAFAEDDVAVAHILGRHAAIAITAARREANMFVAVDARKLVGQAVGILMERYGLDSDRAFQVLRRYSQDNNRKLRDVAQELIDTRQLPLE